MPNSKTPSLHEYSKPPKTFEEQVSLLESRGLIVKNKADAINILSQINYYRLSAYRFPFQRTDDVFDSGTTLDDLLYLYNFDRDLRLLVFGYIEKIEVQVRCLITYNLAHKYSAYGYLDAGNFNFKAKYPHSLWIEKINKQITNSSDKFVEHHKEKYALSYLKKGFPLWIASETFSFDSISTLYANMKAEDQKMISEGFSIQEEVLVSWLHSLCYVRNICAHHGRLWNKKLAISPLIPRKQQEWHTPFSIHSGYMFSAASIINHLLKKSDNSLKRSLINLFDKYPKAPTINMGFLEKWGQHKIWN